MIHPPRIQAKIDATKPALNWLLENGVITITNPFQDPILFAWAMIDTCGVSMKVDPANGMRHAYFMDVAGDKTHYATGISTLEAACKTIRSRVQAEGHEWISEIVRRELQAG